ncbi:MAG TPA: rod shape-determining protein RodA [Polyangia bacterium]|jgi:rod shape determining protein RodA
MPAPSLWRKLIRGFDWPLAAVILAVIAVGLVNLYSATAVNQRPLFTKQLWAFGLGLGCFTAAALFDYRSYNRLAYFAYAGGIALLLVVLVFGHKVNGARRWFDLGFFRLQPSELMKVFMLGAMAKFLHEDPTPHDRSLRYLGIGMAMALPPMVLVLAEPDLGTALIIFLASFTMLLVAKLKAWHLGALTAVGLVLTPIVWLLLLKPYQRNRILIFLDPDRDPSGAGWHARQSIFAIGSGRLTGKGLLHGTQNQLQFLPEHWTDFPFSVLGEEWGFLGGLLLLTLYLFLILWAIKLAHEARDRFGSMLCIGVAALLFWHVFINIGMVSGVLPVVGVTLPLVSYGGSSVITMMIAVGLLMNVSIRRWAY